MKLSIVIPAYNEERRIEKTIRTYYDYFVQKKNHNFSFEIIIVLNGCVDNTHTIVTRVANELQESSAIVILNLLKGGKGLAIKAGFDDALKRHSDLIGFVDADMATSPQAFYDLVEKIDNFDGIIASRYMPGAKISPARPLYKRWGSKIIYEPLVWLLFGLSYYDLQCGAKLFKRAAIEKIAPFLTVRQWAFDVELLYLCKKFGFTVKEIPTVWHDQADSKLTLRGGMRMLGTLVKLRLSYFLKS